MMMKTFLAGAAGVAALAAISPASAQVVPPASPHGTVLVNYDWELGFRNRGQCVSALARERNLQRANPELRGAGYQHLSGPAFNAESMRTTRCELLSNGRFYIVFNAEGF